MSDLAHVNAGYLQVEETAFRRSTDRQVLQKFGKNQNFLKDQFDTANALAASVFGQTSQLAVGSLPFTTDGSGNFQGNLFTTPNGKPILFAILNVTIAGYAAPFPLIQFYTLTKLPLWAGNGATVPNYNGNFPLLSGDIIGAGLNQLHAAVMNGTIVTGFTLPTWVGGTTGTINYTVVYPT